MSRYSANGITLETCATKTGTFNELPLLMEVPEFGATPEKIDVTTLGDKVKNYVNGIKDYGDLVFKFLYDNSAGGSYRLLKGHEDLASPMFFKLSYPDNTAHIFQAIPSVKMDSGTINGALTFSCAMTLQGDIEVTNPA